MEGLEWLEIDEDFPIHQEGGRRYSLIYTSTYTYLAGSKCNAAVLRVCALRGVPTWLGVLALCTLHSAVSSVCLAFPSVSPTNISKPDL